MLHEKLGDSSNSIDFILSWLGHAYGIPLCLLPLQPCVCLCICVCMCYGCGFIHLAPGSTPHLLSITSSAPVQVPWLTFHSCHIVTAHSEVAIIFPAWFSWCFYWWYSCAFANMLSPVVRDLVPALSPCFCLSRSTHTCYHSVSCCLHQSDSAIPPHLCLYMSLATSSTPLTPPSASLAAITHPMDISTTFHVNPFSNLNGVPTDHVLWEENAR